MNAMKNLTISKILKKKMESFFIASRNQKQNIVHISIVPKKVPT